jgi:hypothetical protein
MSKVEPAGTAIPESTMLVQEVLPEMAALAEVKVQLDDALTLLTSPLPVELADVVPVEEAVVAELVLLVLSCTTPEAADVATLLAE